MKKNLCLLCFCVHKDILWFLIMILGVSYIQDDNAFLGNTNLKAVNKFCPLFLLFSSCTKR